MKGATTCKTPVFRAVLTKAVPLLLMLFVTGIGYSQSLSNIRYRYYLLNSDSLLLDTLSIVKGSLTVRNPATGQAIDSSAYTINNWSSVLTWKHKPPLDSVKVFFRVYPFKLGGETTHKDYDTYLRYSSGSIAHPYMYVPEESNGKLIDFGSLDYNGSFSRSVAFGTNQDVVLNSIFNLQLSGMLTRDIEITAAITDNNIPIQPEGNTQKVQEFDKIFIQLRKDQHKVIVGDFDLASPDDYFMKFTRKYEGGYYSGAFAIKKVGIMHTAAAVGVARGKFASNTIAITDGNQGPYKLTGADGETVITILANSESVFINGEKMQRGADRDYVIDYNLGEVTFTPKRIVTQDMRVVVEFQYSNNSYSRSGAMLNTELETKKVNVHLNVFSEQDSKNQNIQQSLTGDQKAFLSTLGDSIQNAFYRGYDTTSYDPNRILYALIDSVIPATPYVFDSVFVYSTDSTVAKYALNFSYVGDGKGNYMASTSLANGRVYVWVQPAYDSATHAFLPQGSYEPVIFLVTPKYQQMYTVGADYKINKNNTLSTEAAMSNTDPNMFSSKDNKSNIGFAGHVAFKGTEITKLDTALKKSQSVTLDITYDFTQNRFVPIERFRAVEFNRDWNLASSAQSYNQHLAAANVGYVWSGLGNIYLHSQALVQDSIYRGFENGINGSFAKNGFNVTFTNSFLASNAQGTKTNFIRPNADFWYSSKKTRGWRIGASYSNEINMFKNAGSDSLNSASYLWQNYRVYASSPDSAKNKYGIEFLMRYQQRAVPGANHFGKIYYQAQTINFTGALASIKNQTLNYTLTYRHAWDADSIGISSEPDNFYLGRIEYGFNVLKGVIRSSTLYEIGTGRQQKIQVVYQADPSNQGDYIWQDFNHNGVKEINEFVLSPYKIDTSYDRLIITTPEFVSVNTNQFNEVLNINPAAVWRNAKGIKKAVSLFSIFASVQIEKKTYAVKGKKVYDY
ncbi:MAG TPA: hypothetical protein VG603_14335, partial [Chitinophagales bacterium]|nr:hypothetical protein [Chitinophagales bacterium]